jgi:hypothetical protein
MRTLFKILKVVIWIAAIIGMYFASHFWIGTSEDWSLRIGTEFWSFFFSRLLFVVVVGGLFFLCSLLLNWLFRKQITYNTKYTLTELFSVVVLAAFMVISTMIK